MLLKIKVSVEPCLVSVVVLTRGCSGTGEYEAGKEKIQPGLKAFMYLGALFSETRNMYQ